MIDSNLLGENIPIGFLTLNYKTKKYIENFQSGNQAIDIVFQKYALDDNDTVTYIFVDNDRDVAIACVSLSCSKIDMSDTTGRIKSSKPAFEIKYFAINKEYHSLKYKAESNRTLSEVIMMDFISYLYEKCRPIIGASFVILYSLKRAVHFYQKCYFENFEDYMLKSDDNYTADCIPMYMSLVPEL